METKKAIEIIQEKIAVNVITDYVKKAGFDPAQERDENGMWTDGDSGGFDAVKKDALKKLNKINDKLL